MELREKIARKLMREVEYRHGTAEGRELLGFRTLEDFINSGWHNYLPYVDLVIRELAFERAIQTDKEMRNNDA
jgi:hypothetical protein